MSLTGGCRSIAVNALSHAVSCRRLHCKWTRSRASLRQHRRPRVDDICSPDIYLPHARSPELQSYP